MDAAERDQRLAALRQRRPLSLAAPPSVAPPAKRETVPPCVHLGPVTNHVECPSCAGLVLLKIFACTVHGECLRRAAKSLPQIVACRCEHYAPADSLREK